MSKKKGHKQIPTDFSLNDFANSPKSPSKEKKPLRAESVAPSSEVSWDQIPDNEEYEIVNEAGADGTTNTIRIKKQRSKPETDDDNSLYPEVLWYQISRRVHPEDIVRFALINRVTFEITQQISFWIHIYEKYCKHSPKLPLRLKIEDGAQTYGYKTRTIRTLYFTHDYFIKKVKELDVHDSQPQKLIKYRCLNVWLRKTSTHWAVFFKFRKPPHRQAGSKVELDFIDELGRLDANPEIDNRILLVNCQHFHNIPPLMGMTLSSVSLGLSKSLCSHKLTMGFTSGTHVVKDVLPEVTVTVEKVSCVRVIDWWHPNYPQFTVKFNRRVEREDENRAFVRDFDFSAPEWYAPSSENY